MKRQVPFIKYQLLFGIISIIIVIGSVFLLTTKGLNFDTDFTGGRKLLYSFTDEVDEVTIRQALEEKGITNVTVRHYGETGEKRFIVKAGHRDDDSDVVKDPITTAIQEKFGADKVTLQQEESVGPKAGAELRQKALFAVLVSCLLILVYIGFRFDFMFAPGAIVALVHDITITLGAISLIGRSFSLTSVAALLTILGYSINDTIILYDRVRENGQEAADKASPDLVNLSINQVLSRTLITSITVLFVVIVLFIIAEGAIQDFAFAMIIGAIAGTYSSIFVASPVYLLVHRWWPKLAGKS